MAMRRRTLLLAAPCLLPIAAAALVLFLNFEALPDPYPTHWNAAGRADSFAARTYSAVFTIILVGAVTQLGLLIAVWGASRRADQSQRPSDALILFACWFTGMVFCLVSILPLVALKSGAPWLLPVILAGTGGLVAIAIRDKRRRRG